MNQNKNSNQETVVTQLLSQSEAAEFFGISAKILNKWTCKKDYPLPHVKREGLIKYWLCDLEDYCIDNDDLESFYTDNEL